jgi:hypothetical protein
MTTKFQQVVVECISEPMDVSSIEAWARMLENRVNQAGLKVVEVYES